MRPGIVLASLAGIALRALSALADPAEFVTDSLRWRFEVGGSTDYTNEIYYLDSLATPTLVERERFEIPESRYAGVGLVVLDGSRAAGGTGYTLSQEVSIGDRLHRSSTTARWRQRLGTDWRLLILPRAQYRKDQTLGRDFEEYQAGGSARLRRTLRDGRAAAEFGLIGDWLRTTGQGTGLLPDRWTLGATTAAEESDFEGVDWRLDYTLRGRVFPDSTVRDHFEHETQGRARLGWGIGNALVVDALVLRRITMNLAPTSRDNFWEESGALDVVQNSVGDWGWPTRLEFEAVQFDLEDDVLYFDHQTLRARTGLRAQPTQPWTLALGPAVEWLRAPRAEEEAYVEYGGFLDFESITSGSLWSLTPSAGRRDYARPAGGSSAGPYDLGRSSYAYLQFDAIGDQRLPWGWRARCAAFSRFEFHDDSSENATSLYFSFDVRRLF